MQDKITSVVNSAAEHERAAVRWCESEDKDNDKDIVRLLGQERSCIILRDKTDFKIWLDAQVMQDVIPS
jgi:hypothetical protein